MGRARRGLTQTRESRRARHPDRRRRRSQRRRRRRTGRKRSAEAVGRRRRRPTVSRGGSQQSRSAGPICDASSNTTTSKRRSAGNSWLTTNGLIAQHGLMAKSTSGAARTNSRIGRWRRFRAAWCRTRDSCSLWASQVAAAASADSLSTRAGSGRCAHDHPRGIL